MKKTGDNLMAIALVLGVLGGIPVVTPSSYQRQYLVRPSLIRGSRGADTLNACRPAGKTCTGREIHPVSEAANVVGMPWRRRALSLPTCLSIRGGSDESDHESDEDDAFDDDDALFDMMDDADFDATTEGDFSEDSLVARITEQWKMTPPLTKAYLTASLAATAMGYVLNKNQFPPILLLEWKPTLLKFQLWRPFTAFLNVGPLGIGYAMTVHFLWTYMATLERLNYDKPYDFWIMILFGCASMVAGYSILNIPPKFLGHNLSTFLVYVWSRYHEGLEVNIMELFTARAESLPWFFLAQTFLMEGEIPVLDLLGIFFGHVYHHFKTTNVIRTPQFIISWYKSDNEYSRKIREKYKTISSDFELQ